MESDTNDETVFDFMSTKTDQYSIFIDKIVKKNEYGHIPLQYATKHGNVSIQIIKSILKAWPESKYALTSIINE